MMNKLYLIVTFICTSFLYGCDDATPEVIESKRFISPDSKFEITDEIVHNGLGMGAGAIFEEVHLAKPGAKFTHGDHDSSAVLYYEADPSNTDIRRAHVSWRNPQLVVVSYPEGVAAAKLITNLSGITIQYEKFNLSSNNHAAPKQP